MAGLDAWTLDERGDLYCGERWAVADADPCLPRPVTLTGLNSEGGGHAKYVPIPRSGEHVTMASVDSAPALLNYRYGAKPGDGPLNISLII